jgi:hypothetical protein
MLNQLRGQWSRCEDKVRGLFRFVPKAISPIEQKGEHWIRLKWKTIISEWGRRKEKAEKKKKLVPSW